MIYLIASSTISGWTANSPFTSEGKKKDKDNPTHLAIAKELLIQIRNRPESYIHGW